MKKIYLLGLLVIFIEPIYCQDSFSSFIDSVYNITDSIERVSYIESFANHLGETGTPYIEGDTANFIYYGNAESVEIAGDFNGWGQDGLWLCERIPQSNFFYYSHTFEPTARLDYKFILNGSSWILDPLNPNTVTGGYGPNSELAMPAYVQPWEIEEYEGVAKGTKESFRLECAELSKNFNIQVYLPPGYDSTGGFAYPCVYVHDGHEYLTLGSMDNVIDNLLDSNKIDPIIGVFIRPIDRNEEYGFSERFEYAQFIAETLVPYIDQHYMTIRSNEYRLTMGCSLGGNISGLIAFTYPEVFGNSGWHSPALWVNDGEVASLFMGEAKDVKIYFNLGTYENLGVDWEYFTGEINSLGYEYEWNQYHEGHSWGLWRATSDEILKYFFPEGQAPLKVEDPIEQKLSLVQNYPNPFSGSTEISYELSIGGHVLFEIYNCMGKPIATLVNEVQYPGKYEIVWNAEGTNAGVYFSRLDVNGSVQIHKLIVTP